jgi:hypothetical protein
MLDLTPAEREIAERCEAAKSYRPGAWDEWALYCTRDVETLLAALTASRQRVAELEERVRELEADDA